MVIKDLLNKVSKPAEGKDEKVKALRDKLAKLQQQNQLAPSNQQTPAKSQPTPKSPQQQTPRPDDKAIQSLADAPIAQQKAFAAQENPEIKIREERTHKLVAKQVNELIELTTEQEKRLKKMEQERANTKRDMESIERRSDEIVEKMKIIDQRLEKFMGLYEVITNQYNPFAEKTKQAPQQAPQPPADTPPPAQEQPEASQPKEVNLSDSLTGESSSVQVSQGKMSSSNQQKMQKLLAELEADEWEKNEVDTEEEVNEITVREEERQEDVAKQLHEMFSQFEARMKDYLEEAMQTRLHETFTQLEQVLNEEIKQAVKEQVSEMKGTDDIISSALEEMEQLSAKTSPEEFKELKEEIKQQVKDVDDHIKAIPPSLYFLLADGRVLKSKQELALALQTMSDETFHHHVSESHNNFADWLELALNDPQGQELRGKNKQEMSRILNA